MTHPPGNPNGVPQGAHRASTVPPADSAVVGRKPQAVAQPSPQRHFSEQQFIVDFALLWMPWGGASSEDIFVRFGLREPDFYARVVAAIESGGVRLSAAEAYALRDHCNRMLFSLEREAQRAARAERGKRSG